MREYKKNADLFKLLSHPVRLQILDELRKRPACVCHLQAVTQRPQAYVSQQLRIMRDANLVKDEKDGQNVYYHLRSESVPSLLLITLGEPKPIKIHDKCNCPFCHEDEA